MNEAPPRDQCQAPECANESTSSPHSRSRTILWCPLRSASTALTKCISEIDDDVEAWFEPYNYCYLAVAQCRFHTNGQLELPTVYEGNEEAFVKAKQFIDQLTNGSNSIPEQLAYTTIQRNLESATSRHVFVKDMGISIADGYYHLLPKGYKHTFLIRNPLRTLYSYRKVMIHMMMSPEGSLQGEVAVTDDENFDLERDDRFLPPGCYVKELYDLWAYVKENIDRDPVVIDTEDLLTKPKETLAAYCAAVGLPYYDGMLQWGASVNGTPKIKACSDDLLEKFDCWFGRAMKSTCFAPPSEFPPRDQITPDVIRLSERVMRYYDEMYETRLKV